MRPASWFGPEGTPRAGALGPRWLFLRALGLIFLSAFLSLAFQIRGLVGSDGILPAGDYLDAVARALPALERWWRVPTLFWLAHGDGVLQAAAGVGMVAALLLTANLWPRVALVVCELAFLSAISVLQVFASYQSDGMLLEAGLVALFLVPGGRRPGLGRGQPPTPAALFLLRWEWFRIYFESGVVKLASGDPQWRHLTAMDHYYENGPLPTWLGWWAEQAPHGWHAFCAGFTLVTELALVWMVWLPRRFRLACFALVTTLQIGIILTANYAFLNYLVLALGFLLLDDRALAAAARRLPSDPGTSLAERLRPRPNADEAAASAAEETAPAGARRRAARGLLAAATALLVAAGLGAFLPVTGAPAAAVAALRAPARWLAPLRVADAYGLFAVMTRARYELEFQGSRDGATWVAYPFRFKPQDPAAAPGIYAPYQPRFEWNLWFASLDDWRANPWVVTTEARLVEGSPDVLALFAADPFGGAPPRRVRVVRWRYWFTDRATRRATGDWWQRDRLGVFAPEVERTADGRLSVVEPAEDAFRR
jgi:Lipase maturation factor